MSDHEGDNVTADSGEVMQDERDDLLSKSVGYVHNRATCDEAGRPLSTYLCEYHDGYRDGLDAAFAEVEQAVVTARRVAGWKFAR